MDNPALRETHADPQGTLITAAQSACALDAEDHMSPETQAVKLLNDPLFFLRNYWPLPSNAQGPRLAFHFAADIS